MRLLLDPEPQGSGGAATDPNPPEPATPPEPKGDKKGDEKDKQFSQADVDRIVRERLDRAKKQADTEAANAKKKADEEALAKQGEWKALAEQREKELAERDGRLTHAQTELQQTRLAHAVELAAYALDFADPEDALKLADLSGVAFDDKGQPDKTAIKKALSELAKAKPHLITRGSPAARGTPPRAPGAPPPRDTPQRRPPRSSALS